MRGRGCIKPIRVKYRGRKKELFVVFMDLEKVYDKVNTDNV